MLRFMQSKARDAVFGMQDGWVSALGALMGIAEGTQSSAIVILAGLVIMMVESLSMAAGSYLCAQSQRQYLERLLRWPASRAVGGQASVPRAPHRSVSVECRRH